MTKRIANFREGDLNEGKGIETLKEIGFVAPIPREEDTGIDAIATLNIKKGRYLYPDRSFSVQIKSKGETTVEWDLERTAWFIKQDLPFYWGVWDKEAGELLLYSTTYLLPHTAIQSEIMFSFQVESEGVWLGPPVARLTLGMNEEERNKARETLTKHINAELVIRLFRKVFATTLHYYWNEFSSPESFQYRTQGALFGETYDSETNRTSPLSYVIDYGRLKPDEALDAELLQPQSCRNRISSVAAAIRMLIIQSRTETDEIPEDRKINLTDDQLTSLEVIYQRLIEKGSFIDEPPHC